MYNNANKADEIYRRKLEQDPNYDKKLVEKWKEEMPEEYKRFMLRQAYGAHIGDRDSYEDAVRKLKWANGKGSGAKWDVDEIANKSGIDFDEEGFSKFDYGAVVNALYADYNTVFTEPSYYLKMARNYLTSKNYPYRPQERAYHDAEMMSRRYNYNNHYPTEYYDNYNYGNRKYDYEDNRRYDYESRRGYDRRADRDNDGRYNE